MIKTILIVLALTSLTACSSVPTVFKVDSAPVERTPLVLPSVDRFDARDVKWIVVTPENFEAIISDLESEKKNIVLFALDEDSQKNLSLNIADILKLVQQQRAIIAVYQEYYNETKQP